MDGNKRQRANILAKLGATTALVTLGEILFDDNADGAVIGGFALVWLVLLIAVRRSVVRSMAACVAALAAGGFGCVLVDDPSPLALLMFLIAISLAALLPRHRFDDALVGVQRLAWHGLAGVAAPLRDVARLATVRERRSHRSGGIHALAATLVLPLGGGALFLALFAGANPLIGNAFSQIVLPDFGTMVWRSLLALVIFIAGWASLRPPVQGTWMIRRPWLARDTALDPRVATLTLSLVTFNAIFAVENLLDLVFLWSGAALPEGVTMADYAHRGAYSLIVTALLAALFVLVALRPGSTAATSRVVRRLVSVWIAQNLLLVSSSALRTLDYVDAYGMTMLRLSALAWILLVAAGLALIGWRLVTDRSAAWLINANALAVALVLAAASVVDVGATAAAWNARVALTPGRARPPLDLCYMVRLGPSALVSLAVLERHARQPVLHDRLGYVRWEAQVETAAAQADWRSWTPRAARRLATVEALLGTHGPQLRPAPGDRGCDGAIIPPSVPKTLTSAAQR